MLSESAKVLALAQKVKAGIPIDLSFDDSTELGRLMIFTKTVGGPIAPTLDRYATVLRGREKTLEELGVAAAGPRASARLVTSLPVLVLLGGAISGIPVLRTLTSSWLVAISLAIGLGLFWLGNLWTKKILASAEPTPGDPGFTSELLAIAISAGMPTRQAIELLGAPEESVAFLETGVAAASLLTDKADELRFQQSVNDRKRIQRASVKILWPLGVTVLPAFVLVAIVPLGIAMLQG